MGKARRRRIRAQSCRSLSAARAARVAGRFFRGRTFGGVLLFMEGAFQHFEHGAVAEAAGTALAGDDVGE
jgi:hypothetical protein